MQVPVELSFRDVERTEGVDELINECVANLERFYDRIVSCRVMIESPHRHRQHGQLYHVRIDLSVPGHEIVVSRDPPQHQKHEHVHVAIRDAFKTMRRQLQTWIAKARGETKTHEGPPAGPVVSLFPDEGYGFIQAADGREIYFHQNSVVDGDFAGLEVGTVVTFVEEDGDEGPQASTVKPRG